MAAIAPDGGPSAPLLPPGMVYDASLRALKLTAADHQAHMKKNLLRKVEVVPQKHPGAQLPDLDYTTPERGRGGVGGAVYYVCDRVLATCSQAGTYHAACSEDHTSWLTGCVGVLGGRRGRGWLRLPCGAVPSTSARQTRQTRRERARLARERLLSRLIARIISSSDGSI